jgi:hypothetical protein
MRRAWGITGWDAGRRLYPLPAAAAATGPTAVGAPLARERVTRESCSVVACVGSAYPARDCALVFSGFPFSPTKVRRVLKG